MKPIRVLIADDHAIVRRGIVALLATVPDLELAGEARNGQEAVELAHSLDPDVILMDLVMPVMDGVEAIQRITAAGLRARILVLTSFGSDDQVFSAIKAGAGGYHLKSLAPAELECAIRQVARGESALGPTIAQRVLQELAHPHQSPDVDPALTPREIEVLRQVAQGRSNREIADELVICEVTVRTHVSNILSKLHLASRTQAALWALRRGVAPLQAPEIAPSAHQ